MSLLVAVLAAVSVLLLLPPAPRPGGTVPGPAGSGDGPEDGAGAADLPAERALLVRLRPLLAGVAAAGGWALVGGLVGVAAALAAATAVWVVLGRTEDAGVQRRREELRADLPTGVDLLASCLDAGAAPESALLAVSQALGGAVGEELSRIRHRLDVGVDPAQVWRSVAQHDELGPLGRAVGRAHASGAPVGEAVHRLADELRDRTRAEVETRARSIEVKAAAPLGLCLLPAFVVLGVVPMVAGVFGAMRLFG